MSMYERFEDVPCSATVLNNSSDAWEIYSNTTQFTIEEMASCEQRDEEIQILFRLLRKGD